MVLIMSFNACFEPKGTQTDFNTKDNVQIYVFCPYLEMLYCQEKHRSSENKALKIKLEMLAKIHNIY